MPYTGWGNYAGTGTGNWRVVQNATGDTFTNYGTYVVTWTEYATTTGYQQQSVPLPAPTAPHRYVEEPRYVDGVQVTSTGDWMNPGRPSNDEEAQQKARELLLDHLTPEQQHMYEAHGWFDVPIEADGPGDTENGDVYRIKGYEGVFRVQPLGGPPQNDHEVEKWCIHIASGYAQADCQLSQLVLLEVNPEEVFRQANRHWKRPRLGPPDPVVTAEMARIHEAMDDAVEVTSL